MRILSVRLWLPLLALLLILFGVYFVWKSDDGLPAPAELDDGWRTQSLAQSGFDLEKMQRLDGKLQNGEYTGIHMVAVEYDGRLVYEKYLSGTDQNWGRPVGHREFDQHSLHDLRSVSKSVTALMLGAALGDSFDGKLSTPIVEFFPELAKKMPPGSEAITLHHVLTMSTGQQWNEMDVRYSEFENDERQLYSADDPIEYVLTKPMVATPGEDWYYNGGSTMVLAALVAQFSGQDFLEFGQQKMAEPLGINPDNVDWRGLGIWKRRLPSAASGLRMRLRDLAKVGSLMLHKGKWLGQQIVPEKWVEISMQRHTEQTYPIWSMDGVYGYGYQWWHGEFTGAWGDFTAATAVGYGGQRIFVMPDRKLSITIFAGNYTNGLWKMSERVAARIVDAAPR